MDKNVSFQKRNLWASKALATYQLEVAIFSVSPSSDVSLISSLRRFITGLRAGASQKESKGEKYLHSLPRILFISFFFFSSEESVPTLAVNSPFLCRELSFLHIITKWPYQRNGRKQMQKRGYTVQNYLWFSVRVTWNCIQAHTFSWFCSQTVRQNWFATTVIDRYRNSLHLVSSTHSHFQLWKKYRWFTVLRHIAHNAATHSRVLLSCRR